MATTIGDHWQHLQEREDDLNQRIDQTMESDVDLQRKTQAMTQLKGVAHPELGTLDRQQVAAIAGVAPHPQESGNWKGKRRIYGGRAAVRKAMYMAAKSAARWCPVISEFYQRLRQNGKSYNTALIACARKMLIRLNTILKSLNSQPPAPNGTQTT